MPLAIPFWAPSLATRTSLNCILGLLKHFQRLCSDQLYDHGTGMIRPRMLHPHTFHAHMIRPRNYITAFL